MVFVDIRLPPGYISLMHRELLPLPILGDKLSGLLLTIWAG